MSNSVSENDVLSMFFDDDFLPHDYLDALFSSSLTLSKPTLRNKSIEFANARSLHVLQSRCSSLLTHFDYYTNELTRQFETKMSDLKNSSSIISYRSETRSAKDEISGQTHDNDDSLVGITRLEYYVSNLSSALNSTVRDLAETNGKVLKFAEDNRFKKAEASVQDLQRMMKVKSRINQVIEVFDTIRSLVASSISEEAGDSSLLELAPTTVANESSVNSKADENAADLHFDADSFGSAISLLKELILGQISSERKKVQSDPEENKSPKKDFVSIIDGMIDLEPFFKSMNRFYSQYVQFVQFLRTEKERYLSIYD
ncbi:hypothetical protein FOA43_001512 [Brettanomyces nanus]|uniref:Uncharacterized protein n=1 Tax=Eeniella nana TaxID=13502 RepID=A0A875RZN3_EENNA|nr:uncharacterized protein FOA43_001512 [Brettanomyces nanus]QPG74188.1 hypothetical protein FOA43_001512 [Brettanomyces nanus]